MLQNAQDGLLFRDPWRDKIVRSEHIISGISAEIKAVERPSSEEFLFCLSQNVLRMQLAADFKYCERSYRTGQSRLLPIGAIRFTPRETEILQRNSAGRNHSVACLIDDIRLQELSNLNSDLPVSQWESFNDIRSDRIAGYFGDLAEELMNPGFSHGIVIESLARLIFCELGKQTTARSADARTTGMAAWQLRKIADFVQSCESSAPTVSELAALVGVSERHLMRVFKNSTGETIHHCVARIRIDKAKSLLMDARMPIKEVSSLLGFSSASGFAVAFRKAVGVPPASFRREAASAFRVPPVR